MKTDRRYPILRGSFQPACLLAALASLPPAVRAGTFSSSAAPPVVNSADVANFAPQTGTDKWFFQSGNETNPADAAKGQTFTTGPSAVLLKALTFKMAGTNKKSATVANPTTWTIRLGTLSGTNFTLIATETVEQTADTGEGHYITWRLTAPVLLSANTTYALDVGMRSRTAWQTGIPYLSFSGNVTTAGVGTLYDSGDLGVGAATVTLTTTRDRVFHVDLEDPMAPSPSDGATVPAGDVTLGWTNFPATTGTDVWVDVWFGTSPAALTKVLDAGLNTVSTVVNAPAGGTCYWRVDSYLNGAVSGSPATGTLFRFIIDDTDGDGIPDSYELAHTSPASATALVPGDDNDGDGLTNAGEFQRGTAASNPDTDTDSLQDGPELTGVGLRPPTDPRKADTDGDGLGDGAETNSGTWVSPANTGTSPTAADTDTDGLRDAAETNSGTYVSAISTGTSPLHPDSDNDGAGDWYEVIATATSPVAAGEKPNIPYPLPDPDTSTGVTTKPVKVYILSGQSNMVGFGRVAGTETGTLETMTRREHKFPNFITDTGAYTKRSDVKYRGVISAIGNADLTTGFGANVNSFGPELGFGYLMGWYHDAPVLIIKTSIGNRSLLWDIAPPNTVRFNYNGNTYAGYGDSPNSWTIGSGPTPFVWYAGKQYDDFFLAEPDMRPGMTWASGTVYPDGCQLWHNGQHYISKDRANVTSHTAAPDSEPGTGMNWATYWQTYSVTNVTDVLDNFATQYPSWAAQGFEIAGFAWWQGDNDMSEPAATKYEDRLVSLITHLRTYYTTRYPGKIAPDAPFVLGTIGFGGWGLSGAGLKVANAQLAVGDTVKYPAFAGNVKTMEARGYWRSTGPDASQGHHYNHNAETFLLLGDALGRGMVQMQQSITNPAGFAAWQAANSTGGALHEDHDTDGVANGIEWFLGGSAATTGFTALPAASGNSVTWTKAAGFTGSYGTSFVVETSSTLSGPWAPQTVGANLVINGHDVTFTFPSAAGGRSFARLRVLAP